MDRHLVSRISHTGHSIYRPVFWPPFVQRNQTMGYSPVPVVFKSGRANNEMVFIFLSERLHVRCIVSRNTRRMISLVKLFEQKPKVPAVFASRDKGGPTDIVHSMEISRHNAWYWIRNTEEQFVPGE